MSLYIQIENGAPINHPALEENLIEAFGAIPSTWEAFVRVPKPTPTLYQVFNSELPAYQKVDGVWTDVWALRDMTAEEIAAKKAANEQYVKEQWADRQQAFNWTAWTFDEATCSYQPPIPRPETGEYFWCGAENNWKAPTPRPQDGGVYKFDFAQWDWVAT